VSKSRGNHAAGPPTTKKKKKRDRKPAKPQENEIYQLKW